jgi:hypothetical protein
MAARVLRCSLRRWTSATCGPRRATTSRELYRDREEPEWPRDPDGRVAMVTDPLDMAGLLAEAR